MQKCGRKPPNYWNVWRTRKDYINADIRKVICENVNEFELAHTLTSSVGI
jgi:hypothetical protein